MIVACGAQAVLIAGEVDLSPGSVAAFAVCISAMVMAKTGSVPLAVLSGLAVGFLFGLLNGVIITR